MPIDRSVPATRNSPSANSMSSTAASSTWPAIRRPRAITASLASRMAPPVAIAEREPPDPPAPSLISSESCCTMRIRSNGTPSVPLSTWAKGVAWPMPKSQVPVTRVTVPSASKRMSASSVPGGAVVSR